MAIVCADALESGYCEFALSKVKPNPAVWRSRTSRGSRSAPVNTPCALRTRMQFVQSQSNGSKRRTPLVA
ncbi:hypothetical protein AWB78_07406 [Caballeronia calidae]|uniref:Uncharacterized protein n=1 Tax=Caballeronia calidae TaxID=1777139 RepID=A0A158EEH9_9BURK|nr:hypothetical protein AWB78_07406 [Caballeronia calidae]